MIQGFMYGKRKEDFMFEDAGKFMFPMQGGGLVLEEYRNVPWVGLLDHGKKKSADEIRSGNNPESIL